MMCPDMTLEQNVLGALAQVKGYKKMGKGHIALCNDAKRPVLILAKTGCRCAIVGTERQLVDCRSERRSCALLYD